MLKKKIKKKAVKKKSSARGRSLISYFILPVVVSALLFFAVIVAAVEIIDRSAGKQSEHGILNAAEAVAARITEIVNSRRTVLMLLASDERLAPALTDDDPEQLSRLSERFKSRTAGVMQIRLLPVDIKETDESGETPLGYAGIDLVRRTAAAGKALSAEVHKPSSGKPPFIAVSVPVMDGEKVAGVLLGSYPLSALRSSLSSIKHYPGWLRVEQVSGGKSFVLAESDRVNEQQPSGTYPIPGTLWQVAYRNTPETNLGLEQMLLFAIMLGSVVILILVVWIQKRKLSRDIGTDMDSVVAYANAMVNRERVPAPKPAVKDSEVIFQMLGELLRKALVSDKAAMLENDSSLQASESEDVKTGMDISEITETVVDRKAVPVEIFRAYDVRGIVGKGLSSDTAELLGRALGSWARERGEDQFVVGRDVRNSSPELYQSLMVGLLASGCDVTDIGEVPTPLMYFATHTTPVRSGIIVTGSHNPPEYNGFKIILAGEPLAEQGLQELRKRIISGEFVSGSGKRNVLDLSADYIQRIQQDIQIDRALKVVVDGGNGVAGQLAVKLLRALGCEVVELFCEPDGDFPNHHPDPGQPENMQSLILEVAAQRADLGLALDGDGDRLGLVDNAGQLVSPDLVLMLLAADILERHPGVDIVFDVKSSRHLAGFILANGGRPIMWKTGHTRIKAKMRETGALLGGEFSGHCFIKDRWYGFDDALYVAARLLEILGHTTKSAAEVFGELPASVGSPEYQLNLEEGQQFALMHAIKAKASLFKDANIIDIDGLRVEFENAWGLVRPSNTTPSLAFRFEADNESALDGVKKQFSELILSVVPDAKLPF